MDGKRFVFLVFFFPELTDGCDDFCYILLNSDIEIR